MSISRLCDRFGAHSKTRSFHGIPADTAALGAAIDTLSLLAGDQDEAGDDRVGMTNEKIIAANALYADCQTIQNAARLQYPGGFDSHGNAQNLTPRARFLLDSFPPRAREEDEEEEPVTAPAA